MVARAFASFLSRNALESRSLMFNVTCSDASRAPFDFLCLTSGPRLFLSLVLQAGSAGVRGALATLRRVHSTSCGGPAGGQVTGGWPSDRTKQILTVRYE